MRKGSLEGVTFLVGAAGMILELAGSRVIAPYLGTSLVVWSSLIGVVLGSLSLGYFLGGRLADRQTNPTRLVEILLIATFLALAIVAFQSPVLSYIANTTHSLQFKSLSVTVLLFFPINVLLGMVTPYVLRLRMENVQRSGQTAGNLYAFSTLGSITGTFLAGFVLIEYLRTNMVLLLVALVLLVASVGVGVFRRSIFGMQIILLILILFGFDYFRVKTASDQMQGFVDEDSRYARIWIYSQPDEEGREVRYMQVGNEFDSGMYLDSDELVFDYTRFYRLAKHFNPEIKQGLMIGGAGYSYPKDFLRQYPNAHIDVVEIDPKVTKLAREYFRLPETDRLTIYHEDGRTFLNTATQTYDAIYGDAFKSHAVPYQLATQEAIQKMYDRLSEKGVVVMNVIGAMEGEGSQFVRAEYATFKSVFPYVYLLPVQSAESGEQLQNIMIVALKSSDAPVLESSDPELADQLSRIWQKPISNDLPLLTDSYAPVDRYLLNVL